MIDAVRQDDFVAVGLGVPSVVEFETGRVVSSVNVPLADVPLRQVLGERLGVPAFVDNDATVAALAEAHDAEFKLVARDLVMLTVGTGVGGGLVLGGRIYRGATGGAAELGHTLVGLDLAGSVPAPTDFPQPGSLEYVASGHALDRLAAQAAAQHPESALGRLRAEGKPVLGADAVQAARAGDDAAGRIDQHVRPGGGGDRRRGRASRRPAAGAGPTGGARVRASRSWQAHDDPPRPTWCPRRGAGRRLACRPRTGARSQMIVACGFDHAGVSLRERLLPLIGALGHQVLDLGTDRAEPPIDYPDKALSVGRAVVSGEADRGIIVCGSGAGVSVAACKIRGVRAATIHDTYTAHQAVEHDGVNVLCLGGRVIGVEVAAEIVAAFLAASVSDEERHVRRRAEVDEIERTGGVSD
jgi:RpiB/LacA/LacB family sugar-phosphate isomerase